MADVIVFATVLWLALRYQRWWPLGAAITPLGEASAQLGLGMLAILMQAAGAFERWLAGEAPASASAARGRRQRAT